MGRIDGLSPLGVAAAAFHSFLLATALASRAGDDPAFDEEMAGLQPVSVQVAEAIKTSRAAYRGKCACPYDRDKAGRSCGKRSTFSRKGGAAVLCYPSDVQ